MTVEQENELIEKFKNIKEEKYFFKEMKRLKREVKDLPDEAEATLLMIAETNGIDTSKYISKPK